MIVGIRETPQELAIVEAVARAIDPGTFRDNLSLYEYCIRHGDSQEEANRCADTMHPLSRVMDKARAAILAYQTVLESQKRELADAHSKNPPEAEGHP